MHKKIILIISVFLLAIAIAGTGYAEALGDDVYVDPDGDDSNPGTAEDPYKTISVGVENVGEGKTVHLSAGTFDADDGNANKDYDIYIAKDLTIQGAGKDKTFIDGKNLRQIFSIKGDYTVTIKDLTIKNCNNVDYGTDGGAIILKFGKLNLINCNFINNKASDDGGAIFCSGTVTVKNCLFKNNQASGQGGAIYNVEEYGGDLTVIDSTFTGNQAAEGGAIYNNGGNTVIKNCLFQNNMAHGSTSGGAIYSNCGSTLTVTGSTFKGNSAANGHGGAIFVSAVMLKLIGNNFIQNTGNAIYILYFPASGTKEFISDPWEPSYIINVNRIVKNSDFGLYIDAPRQLLQAASSDGIYPIDATNNWWGSNNDPRTLSNAVYDPMNLVDLTKWLVLKIGASPNKVPFGSTSLVTASVIYNNLGEDTSSIGHIPDGTPITITTDIGNVGSKQVTRYTVDGIVTTILRADDGLGTAHLYAILDGFKIPLPAQVIITAAASEVGTIGMQETGTPLAPAVLALLMVLGGVFSTHKKIKGV